MQAGFAIAFVALAATAIYAAAKGATLPLAFLAKPWIIAAIVSCVAVYFAAQAYSSYQQMNAMEGAKGKDGVDGKDGTPGKVLSDDDLKGKVKEILPTLLVDPNVVTADVKAAFKE
ncbi:hypothetical protein [Wolbachia endosymbiont (group A) of Barypeithes pellucidus]|uniref:hypothetical protein n=1 Tax=Wolbachia endosymbiont (group A) of Barypeithes pellucidus TaxID=3139322 RepID=UPI003CCAFBA3